MTGRNRQELHAFDALPHAIRILYVPPYYETDFGLVLDRFVPSDKHTEYQVFTLDPQLISSDLNTSLSMCRTIVQEEQIRLLITDSRIGQLIVGKLHQEHPSISSGSMHFLSTFQCINRCLIGHLFGFDQCIPTLVLDRISDTERNWPVIETFLAQEKSDGYVKSVYGVHHRLSSFRFSDSVEFAETIDTFTELYQEEHRSSLASLFRIYLPVEEYSSFMEPIYLVQPFLDLTRYPYWRLVIASACIYAKEIIMWPLVDGYSGWPFLAEKPLALLPIIVCPSRQISAEQQSLVYARFRLHLTYLITHHHLRHGWIECSYFVSSTNEIRLTSVKPTYSVHLTEGFRVTSQHGEPLVALVHLASRERPSAPILNGKTVYIHRLWTKAAGSAAVRDLININEVQRIHRSDSCLDRYVRLRFQADEQLTKQGHGMFTELGFLQVSGDYHELGLANLIDFRSILLRQPEHFPFVHQSMLVRRPDQFDPLTCLPSNDLLERLERCRKHEAKDLI